MKIVYVIESLGNPGGMERVLSTKCNYLADELGYDVTVITRRPLPADSFFIFSPRVQIDSLGLGPDRLERVPLLGNRSFRRKLTTKLMNCQADVVISMGGSESAFLPQIKDGSSKVFEFHFSRRYLEHLVNGISGLRFRALKRVSARLRQFAEWHSAAKFDALILLTRRDQMLWGKRFSRSEVIPNPLSFRSDNAAPLEAKRIVAIGRFIAQKGFDLLIEAFARIAARHPDWELCLVGTGQDGDLLRRLVERNMLTGRVTFRAPTAEVAAELCASSIFAFPSRYEGFGLVLTEAMECGVPCVAFDCECGPGEIIADGEDGFLVPAFDLKQFAEKLSILMADKELRRKFGENARHNVQRFYPENIMCRWDELFHKLRENR